ncbi:hypothetical protein BDW75DRAFT_249534 [Aspergillus navahoensis]
MFSDNLSARPMPRPPRPDTTTSSSAKATHTIQVGPKEDPHGYVPHSLNASVGDLIVFEFYPRNHSVVQADWKAPCMPADGDYFFSGIKNDFDEVNGQVVGELPTWNWTVDREEPTFFYCTGRDSCIGNGMVGVINPNKTQTWESQQKAALEAPYMLLPGQSMPAEGSNLNTGTTATRSSPSSTTDHHAPLYSSPSIGTSSPSHTLSAGTIVGIAVGPVAFVVILCVLLFPLGWNRVYKQWLSQSHEETGGSTSSSKNVRTARWVEACTSAGVGVGADAVRNEGHGGSTGRSGNLSVHGPSPVHEPAAAAARLGHGSRPGTVTGAGTGVGTGFVSINHNLPQVLIPQQQQQHYWSWVQSIQPFRLGGREGEPTELEADNRK